MLPAFDFKGGEENINNNELRISEYLGRGGICVAYEIKTASGGRSYVGKQYSDIRRYDAEIKSLEVLNQKEVENIPDLIGVSTIDNPWLLESPVGRRFDSKSSSLSPVHVKRIVLTLFEVHCEGICHRDPRITNILDVGDDNILLNDWGESVFVIDGPVPWSGGNKYDACEEIRELMLGRNVSLPELKHDFLILISSLHMFYRHCPLAPRGVRSRVWQDAIDTANSIITPSCKDMPSFSAEVRNQKGKYDKLASLLDDISRIFIA